MRPDRVWRAWLTEAARAELVRAANVAHPKETGGILVGVHTRGARPWIVRVVEIPTSDSGVAHYVVPPNKRRQSVGRLRRRLDPRLGYLGEWHSHPLDAPPSITDRASILAIAKNPKAGCPRPVLIVAQRTVDSYALQGLQVHRGSLRELRFVAAGDLQRDPVRRRRRPRLPLAKDATR